MWKWHLLCRIFSAVWRDPEKRIRQLKRLRGRLTEEIARSSASWETSASFAKRFEELPGNVLPSCSKVALVMQGPIVNADNLTLETIKLYVRAMPQTQLILSTWKHDNQDVCEAARDLGVRVVVSAPLECGGPANINRQIRTTAAGIRAACESGAEYVLKTRTDTRLYATNVADFLVGLTKTFPLAKSVNQRHRIVLLDLATRMYLPHHASDMLMFGHIDDLVNYWDLPLFDANAGEDPHFKTFGQLIHRRVPEVSLCSDYLRRIGYAHQKSIASWWQVLADLFLVVDRSSLGFFWPKYNYAVGHTISENDQLRNLALVTFRDWVNIALFAKKPGIEIDQLTNDPINGLLYAA